MTTLDEAIEVLEGMKAGRTVEVQCANGAWLISSPYLPNFSALNYRLKPEPAKLYLVRHRGTGEIIWRYESLQKAREALARSSAGSEFEIVEFTESGVVK